VQNGVATIEAGGARVVVFVANPFVWDVNEPVIGSSANISVMIDAPSGTTPTSSSPVSVAIDATYDAAAETAAPVSVIIGASLENSQSVSGGVSVRIQ